MKKLVVLFAALFVSVNSHASFSNWLYRLFSTTPISYGAWECSWCSLPAPGSPASIEAPSDIVAYIYATNGEIHANEKVARWIPNSTITICNATNCLTVIYQASGKWFPVGPTTPRGSRTVKVPKNSAPPINHRPITVSYEGPAPTNSATWHVYIGPLTTLASPPAPQPEPATRTGSVTIGPMVVVGSGNEFTRGFTDGLSKEIGEGVFESLEPSDAGTYGGGGTGKPGAIHFTD